jgi:tetratricopeptide (TPR) repeat protein
MITRILRELGKIIAAAVIVVAVIFVMLFLLMVVFVSRYPEDLAIDGQSNLYTLDSFSGDIRKFTPDGEQKATFGGGRWPFSGDAARKVTVDGRSNVYWINSKPGVVKYSQQGQFLTAWDLPKHTTPSDIAADNIGNIYVGYSNATFFHKFDTSGNLLTEWTPPHQLAKIRGARLAVDSQNYLYVADSKENIVYKYDSAGNLLAETKGINDLWRAFAVDQNGYLYTFSTEAMVQKWDWNGNLVKSWGGKGENAGQFEYKYGFSNVSGLAVDERNQLSVLYRNNDQAIVQQYTTSGQYIRRWTDGYPNGTFYLVQVVAIFIIVFVTRLFRSIRIKFNSDGILKPALLPRYVLAAGYIPELLQDKIGQTNPVEGKPKAKEKSEADKARLCIEQALGTFEPNQHKSDITIKNLWNFSSVGNLMSQFIFQVVFPIIMFILLTRLRLPWGVTVTFSIFSVVLFLIFAGLILYLNRNTQSSHRLTKNDIIQLLGINLVMVVVFLTFTLSTELVVKSFLTRDDFLYYPLPLMVTLIAAVITFPVAISITLKLWLNAPYNAGKYELTLRRAGAMRRIFNTVGLWVLEAEAYRRMGKLDEAEKVYYEALTQAAHQEATPAALLLEGLALVRMEQERYPESLYLLEKSYDLNPERNSPLIYGAENYIRARLKNERAWELLEQAKNINEISALKAIRLSLEALLLGREKWFDQAEYFIENALDSADPKFKPGIADIHLRAAIIADMQGNDAAALEHYRQVQLNDPFGVNGTRASRILRFSATPSKEPVNLP